LNTEQISKLVVESLENIKGQNIEVFDVRSLTPITDCMILCTGTSSTHIKALADEVEYRAKQAGHNVKGVEGRGQSDWVLVDLGDVVVHLMLAATRSLYRLEDLWDITALKPADPSSDPV
jgi:ribosome-associated protein